MLTRLLKHYQKVFSQNYQTVRWKELVKYSTLISKAKKRLWLLHHNAKDTKIAKVEPQLQELLKWILIDHFTMWQNPSMLPDTITVLVGAA